MKTIWARKCWTSIILSIGMGFLSGCKVVPLQDQRLVSKHNMTFSDSPVFTYQSTVLTQIEPGTAGSGGAQAAGCTACQ